ILLLTLRPAHPPPLFPYTTLFRSSLGRLHVPATTARVQFANETSAKGGPAARCSITVDLPRRPELHADITAESFRLAFEQAFAMLERQVERDRARRREERRRPKKYYL